VSVAPRASSGGGETKSFAALRHPGFRHFWTGALLATTADSVEHVVSYWMIFQKFHSPMLGGFAIFSHWVPFLLFSMWSGALADRFDPRRLMQIGLCMFACASLGWGILFATGTLEPWHAMVLLSLHGMAGVINSPSQQLLVHDIVGRRELQSGVRLVSTSRTLGQLGGPAVGGALMVAFGPEYAILGNALFYLPQILWLWKAPYGPKFRKPDAHAAPARRAPREQSWADIWATLREIASNRTIMSMICLAGGTSLFIGNAYQSQMPEFALDLGHGDPGWHYSMLIAAQASGALVAAILLESRGLMLARPRFAIMLAMIWCFAIGGFAMSESYPLSIALLFVAGLVNLTFGSMSQSLVQLEAAAHLRGRVVGLYNMFGQGLRAISGATVGAGGELIGIHWALAGSALLLLAAMSVLFAFAMRAAPAAAAPGE
jgi:MFS family permease